MSLTLITGPANAGKAEVVMDALRRHLAHGEKPLLVVPTRADVAHYLRELCGDRAAVGVRVERFSGLIAEAVQRAGVSEPLLGAVARERLIETLVRDGSGPVTPGFVRALAELLGELQVRRVAPARLRQALAAWTSADGVPPSELGALFADYCATLARIGRMDSEQRAVRALDELREHPARWGRSPVLFYGFDDLTPLQLDTIETLARLVDAPVTVSLAYEPGRVAFAGRSASFHALAPIADEHRQLEPRSEHYARASRGALTHLERSLFEVRAARVDPGEVVRLLEGGGERAELELVADELAQLLRQGADPDEVAVLVRGGGNTIALLEEVFAAAGIPYSLRRHVGFGNTAVGRALLGLLRCVPSPDGSSHGELGDLLAWLRAPGLLEHRALADSLELTARRTGASSAAAAREIWERRHWPLTAIERLEQAQTRGPMALCDRAARELHWLFCAPRRADASVLDPEERDDASALASGSAALAELRELARVARALVPASAEELAGVLARLELFGEEAAAPGTVAVLDPLGLRARRVRTLFVCGLQERVFPARSQPKPFLAEDERRRLAEVSGLHLGERADPLASERYLLYAALSRPEERLFLSWHLADDDGENTPRSLFVDDVCDLFGERLATERRRRSLGAVPRASGDHGVARVQAREARPDETLRHELVLDAMRERVWSASSIEKWISCPVAWYVERLLEPRTLEPDPEPFARGGLAHAALKDTLEGLRRETGSARVTRANVARARELLAEALATGEAARPLSVTPARRVPELHRLRADLERYLEQAATDESRLEPSELELGFGFAEGDVRGEGSSLPVVELADGIFMRGRIDRVDVAPGEQAVVYDYKTSQAPPGSSWLKDGELQVALYMLAVEQLRGIRAVGGFYQPLSGEDLRARGVLDADAELELDSVRTDLRSPDELHELLREASELAREAALAARRGELEARPATCAYRGGCRYPTICRCEW